MPWVDWKVSRPDAYPDSNFALEPFRNTFPTHLIPEAQGAGCAAPYASMV